jgi:hypothetical protein
MARTSKLDYDKLSPFAKWLVNRAKEKDVSFVELSSNVDMSLSQLHKIIKSYEPRYNAYQRPGYEKTVAIGQYLEDLRGALENAGYPLIETAQNEEELRTIMPHLSNAEARQRAEEEQKYSINRNEIEYIPSFDDIYGELGISDELIAARADGLLTKEVVNQIKKDVIRTLNAQRYERSQMPEPEPEEGQR